jgi:GTP-binding protein LepA
VQGDVDAPFRLLLFDAKSDEFRGVICMVLVKDGCVRKGDRFKAVSTGEQYDVLEVPHSFSSLLLLVHMKEAQCKH